MEGRGGENIGSHSLNSILSVILFHSGLSLLITNVVVGLAHVVLIIKHNHQVTLKRYT